MASVGIWSIGTFLPEHRRSNDWWPQDIVDGWISKQQKRTMRGVDAPGDWDTPGAHAVKAAMAQSPAVFMGIKERRVLEAGKKSSDMEIAAAADALSRANVDAKDVDFLIIQSTVPDFLNVSNGPLIHEKLGLRPDCQIFPVDGMCNSFQLHFQLADMLINSKRGRVGIMIQSTLLTRLFKVDDPFSAMMGDGATAQVVGSVKEGYGLLGEAQSADGSVFGGIVTGSPGQENWYASGTVHSYIHDAFRGRQMFLKLFDTAADVIKRALKQANVEAKDVSLLAAHQPALWFPIVAKAAGELVNAVAPETYPWAGNMIGSNLPLVLTTSERENILKDGQIVCMMSGAAGQMASGSVVRWGGR